MGAFIGAVFGTVFVLVNASAPIAQGVGIGLRVLAVVVLGGIVLLGVLVSRMSDAGDVLAEGATPGREADALVGEGARPSAGADGGEGRPSAGGMFGSGYRWVVLGEAIALFGGFPVLRQLGAPTQANVAWIAVVVGVHFLVLARVWRQPTVLFPGVGLTLLGVAGFALVAGAAERWVPTVSGVGSGFVLLAGTLGFALREYAGAGRAGLSR